MKKLNKIEWSILDNLSNDWECPATICPEISCEVVNISRENILKTLHLLFNENFIQIKDIHSIKLDELLSEPDENFDTKFWFGLTDKGCNAWESQSIEFNGEPITWKNAWTGNDNFQEKIGYVDGINKTVCIEGLKFMYPDSWKEKLQNNLIEEKLIDGFYAKYYKYISGGYRIKYTLNEKSR